MEKEADRAYSICVLLAACCLYVIYFQTTAFHNLITAPILIPKGIFWGACQIKGAVVIQLGALLPTMSHFPSLSDSVTASLNLSLGCWKRLF